MNTNESLAAENCCQKTSSEVSRQAEKRLLFELCYLESADWYWEVPAESDDLSEFAAAQPKSRKCMVW